MNDFKKRNKFGGGEKGDRRGNNSGKRNFRPAFGGGFQNRREGGFSNNEMFQATCASCGKTCEVPFRPNGKKPVYCKDCFANNGGSSAPARNDYNDRAPRRDFQYQKPQENSEIAALRQQINALHTKIDTIIASLTHVSPVAEPTPKEKKPRAKKK